MNCDRAQPVLSARMDGERVAERDAEAAALHAATCPRCAAFAEGAMRVRTAVRIRPAEPVPDLVGPIMSAVARGAEGRRLRALRPAVPGLRPALGRGPRHRRRRTLAPAVAAAIAGVVAGSVVVGGPWQRPTDRPIAAAAVVREVRMAAPRIEAFRGTYAIVERGFSPSVPERRFEMEVAFRSPQRFRLEVRDRTEYPSRSWTPNDLTYVEGPAATFLSGPSGCPGDLAPAICPPTRAIVTEVSTFSTAAPLSGDVVLPLATFASPRGFDVMGRGALAGREVVRVALSFDRASAMFPFLRLGGSWRPVFDRDRVVLTLDAGSWRPVRWVVTPSASPERRGWELRFGLPQEEAGTAILDVRLVSSSDRAPDRSAFAIPGDVAPAVRSLEAAAARLGHVPAVPAETGSLELVSVVLPAPTVPATPTSVAVFADGLDYLRVGERRGWRGPGPFGPLDAEAELVRLPGGGVAYYEPAGEGFGRRLALHTDDADVYLETNLPRGRLLEIAASLPGRGRPLPAAWLDRSSDGIEVERVPLRAALRAAGVPRIEGRLPGGYRIVSAEVSSLRGGPTGVTLHLRQPEMDVAGEPLVLHVEPATALPPASGSSQTVRLVAGEAHWSPARSLLEWVHRGTYHSLRGTLPLARLLEVANAVIRSEGGA
jgi:hypothetical protein